GARAGPQPVDHPPATALPQCAGEPQGWANDQEVVELVEVPLIEQEFVKRLLLAGELDRQLRPANVELPGDDEADPHQHRWRHGAEVWKERKTTHLESDHVP